MGNKFLMKKLIIIYNRFCKRNVIKKYEIQIVNWKYVTKIMCFVFILVEFLFQKVIEEIVEKSIIPEKEA